MTTQVLRRLLWNQNPRLIRLERSLKSGVLIVAPILFLGIATIPNVGLRPGLMIVGVLVLAVGTWESAACLTKRRTYFSPTIFWCSVFLLCALVLPTVLSPIPVVLAGVVLVLGRRLTAWRRRIRLPRRPRDSVE